MTLRYVLSILLAGLIVNAAAASEPLLPACPASPNCVSSLATDSHFIPPLSYAGQPEAAIERLKELLEKRDDTRRVAADSTMVRVEFRTLLGFVDDGEFVLDAARNLIQWRSAARSGYWDLGKNRRRLEEIRQQFEQPPGR